MLHFGWQRTIVWKMRRANRVLQYNELVGAAHKNNSTRHRVSDITCARSLASPCNTELKNNAVVAINELRCDTENQQ